MKNLPEIEKRLNEIQELVEEEFKDLYRVNFTIDEDGYRRVTVLIRKEKYDEVHNFLKFAFTDWRADKVQRYDDKTRLFYEANT